ncbi:MAG: GNAT family N-acetyltransferase [Anaerolineae bacterium]|nr:GNAT family N-acetyltransferase [Anaerolineae bacterium]
MQSLNREERKTLRTIQAHIRESTRARQAIVEQLGTVDVYFHPSNPDPYLNCATPHKGVAWVRRDDLYSAFTGLERLGRVPRLVFQDALFPYAFQQQLALMGLTLEEQRVIMVYRPLYGPDLPNETPRDRLPAEFDYAITAKVATTPAELGAWQRVFKAGYYNTETLTVNQAEVKPLVEFAQRGEKVFVMASYQDTPLGTAQICLREESAEIEAVVTAPLWHGMGLETALITTAVRATLEHKRDIIFTIAPEDSTTHLYRMLGFVDLTHVMTFWQAEEYSHTLPTAETAQNNTAQTAQDLTSTWEGAI